MKRVITYLHYGYELFIKRLFVHLLLIAELCASVVAVNLAVSMIQGLYTDVNILRSTDEDTLFVMPSYELSSVIGEDFLADLDIRSEYTVGEAYTASLTTPVSYGKVLLYNDTLLSQVSLPLSKGGWDAPAITEQGRTYYPLVVNNESVWRLGDRFEAEASGERIYCYIAGVLGDSNRYLIFSASSSAATTAQIVDTPSETLELYGNAAHFPLALFTYHRVSDNKLLFLEKATPEDIAHDRSELRKVGFVFTRDEIIENSMDEIENNVRYYLPLCLGVLVVSLIGLLSYVMLSLYKDRDFYKIAMICGARRRDRIAIAFCQLISVTAVSAALLGFVYAILYFMGIRLYLSGIHALTALAIYTFLLLVGFLMSLLFFIGRAQDSLDRRKGVHNDRDRKHI